VETECGVSGALLLEEAETWFVVPLREAVAHFARRNTRSTDTEQMGGSDNADAHASIDASANFGAGLWESSYFSNRLTKDADWLYIDSIG
jgi:hypothetical protein